MMIQVRAPAAAAVWVAVRAWAVARLLDTALPALKPNQPTHSRPAPIRVMTRLLGWKAVCGYPRREPRYRAATSPLTPEEMCTTVPPAKSIAPILNRKPSAAPDPVAQRVVDQQAPEGDEDAVGAEADALGEGPGDQRRRDDRELALEHREHVLGHVVRVHDLVIDAPQEEQAGVPAAPAGPLAEAHHVAADHPQHADDAHGREAVHHRAQHVLRADQPAVEHRQPRDHQQHQGRGGQHPGRGPACPPSVRPPPMPIPAPAAPVPMTTTSLVVSWFPPLATACVFPRRSCVPLDSPAALTAGFSAVACDHHPCSPRRFARFVYGPSSGQSPCRIRSEAERIVTRPSMPKPCGAADLSNTAVVSPRGLLKCMNVPIRPTGM